MLVTSIEEFQKEIFKQLSFTPFVMDNYILYRSPKQPGNGYCIQYRRPGYYEFGIADYTIPNNFDMTFNNPSTMLRFGTVYEGVTKYRLSRQPISSFSPSSFLVLEKELHGKQVWTQGQHFHGAEITIHKAYFEEVVLPSFPSIIDYNKILFNYTYHSLPIEIITIIQKLQGLAFNNTLTPLYLESKILECIAILANEFKPSTNTTLTEQLHNSTLLIGKNRKITLTSTDIHAIKRAYDVLTDDPFNPPTIETLSKLVLLNQQKLKAGFQLYYHQSIGKYTNTLRMATAANLLLTTDLSIEAIGQKIGYNYSANFTKMFKKTYEITALQYRKKGHSKKQNREIL